MSWQEVSLGDAIHIKHGFAFKSEYFSEDGRYVVLTPGNFYEQGGFRPRPGKDRCYQGDIPDGYILSKGDVIVAMTEQGEGLLGSSAWVPEDDKYLHNQRLGLVDEVDGNLLDSRFLYHLFNTRPVRQQIYGSATGTKVRHTAPVRIYRVKVKVPPVSQQRRIADIIDGYDDLIESNQRRIQLLEESARLLYKEWFVHLRFPGHAHIKITNGVPEGWSRKSLSDIATLNYGKALKKDARNPGMYPVFGSSGVVGEHDKAYAEGPGIIVGRKGNVGSVYWSDKDFYPIDTVYFVSSDQSSVFLYHALKNTQFISTDVAVPGLNRNIAHSREILVPNDSVFQIFEEYAQGFQAQIAQLCAYNERLAKARDLLLPKLMNGELAA